VTKTVDIGATLRRIPPEKRLVIACELRDVTGLTLAKRTGIHNTKLSLIMRGHRNPSADEQRAIAECLSVPVAVLFPTPASEVA
jgi:transcriptional regulator with XRE-family HTH domain